MASSKLLLLLIYFTFSSFQTSNLLLSLMINSKQICAEFLIYLDNLYSLKYNANVISYIKLCLPLEPVEFLLLLVLIYKLECVLIIKATILCRVIYMPPRSDFKTSESRHFLFLLWILDAQHSAQYVFFEWPFLYIKICIRSKSLKFRPKLY